MFLVCSIGVFRRLYGYSFKHPAALLALVAIFGYLHFALKSNDPLEKANREFRNRERVK